MCSVHSQSFLMYCMYVYATATARPVVQLANSTLHSLSLTWGGVSTADVTSFTVNWSPVSPGASGSHTLGSDSFHFTVPELVSNAGYTIRVEAAGPLGKANSSAVTYYTVPRGMKGVITIWKASLI